jgi:hypothetical protein
MHLAQDNDVVYTLTPDRSDQPFGKAVLPGRGWRVLIRAIDDARGILREFIEPGPSDAMRTVERLLILLDRNDVQHALDRTKRRRVIRLVE